MDDVGRTTRRRVLAAAGAAGLAGLAGCIGDDQPTGDVTLADFRGSGPLVEGRPDPDAPSIDELGDLSGELNVYLGGGEGGLYEDLVELLERMYDDFTANVRPGGAANQANTIVEEQEGGGSPADVFWSVDAGSLAALADADYTEQLPEDVVGEVPAEFAPDRQWVGTAGRARAIPYNTDQLSASDVPDKVRGLPDSGFAGQMGWAPAYGAFQSFVTAMRITRGADPTRRWLTRMDDAGTGTYSNEFLISNAVADGELAAGFANHYYALRVQSARPDAPIDLAFTSGDAGALINAAGAAVVSGTDQADLAEMFVAHLLSGEAQEFFATRAFGYPMVPGVPPVGGLPTIDELNPPDLSLQRLSDVEPTLELLREVGLL